MEGHPPTSPFTPLGPNPALIRTRTHDRVFITALPVLIVNSKKLEAWTIPDPSFFVGVGLWVLGMGMEVRS